MSRPGGQRAHAARVALGATALVAVVAVVIALVANLLILRRLDREVDVRLMSQVEHVAQGARLPPVTTPDGGDGDLDDAPVFVWRVDAVGRATALTGGAPSLPRYDWSGGTATLTTGGSTFRLTSARSEGGWLVAGESIVRIGQIRGDLIVVELALGALLLAVTFAGSFIVGLRASAPIEQIRRRQSEFTADASHELRTPLSVIQAEVDLALSRDREPASYRATLARVASESGRLRSIVDNLLWLARHDADASAAATDGVADVRAIANQCAERFEVVAVTAAIELVRPEPGPVAPVVADPEGIDRLVSVLLDNACRYAGPGGKVDLQVTCSAGQVTMIVDDSGPGVPVDQQELILDRFHRADDRPGGTGLGLAIADAVVRSTNGTWSIGRSRLGGAHMAVSWRGATDHDLPTDMPQRNAVSPVAPTTTSAPADRS